MSLRDITRQSVLEAIEEFDQVGRNYFLKKSHFGHAKSYWLVYDGRKYDSKAIIGVAHKTHDPIVVVDNLFREPDVRFEGHEVILCSLSGCRNTDADFADALVKHKSLKTVFFGQ